MKYKSVLVVLLLISLFFSCKKDTKNTPTTTISYKIKQTSGTGLDYLNFSLKYFYDELGRVKNINGVESARSINCVFTYDGREIRARYDNNTTLEFRNIVCTLDADSSFIANYKDEYSNVQFVYEDFEGKKRLKYSYNSMADDTIFENPVYENGNLVYCEYQGKKHFLKYHNSLPNVPGVNTLNTALALGKYDKLLGFLPFSIGTQNTNLLAVDSIVDFRNYVYEYHFDEYNRIDYYLVNGATTQIIYN